MEIFTKQRKGVELWGELRAGLFEDISIQVFEHYIRIECFKSVLNCEAEGCVLEGLTNKKERDKIGKEGDK